MEPTVAPPVPRTLDTPTPRPSAFQCVRGAKWDDRCLVLAGRRMTMVCGHPGVKNQTANVLCVGNGCPLLVRPSTEAVVADAIASKATNGDSRARQRTWT